jgi:hypothetical protein
MQPKRASSFQRFESTVVAEHFPDVVDKQKTADGRADSRGHEYQVFG